jgi:hypothetical protein
MARDVNFNQAILEDGDFAGWSPDTQRAWFVLRLDPRVGISGLGRVAIENIPKTLGVGKDRAAKILRELTAATGGLAVEYDLDVGVLWFRGAFGREPNSPTVRSAAARDILRLPDSPVVGRWFARYWARFTSDANPGDIDKRTVESLIGAASRYGLDTVSIPYRYRTARSLPVPGNTTLPLPLPQAGGESPPPAPRRRRREKPPDPGSREAHTSSTPTAADYDRAIAEAEAEAEQCEATNCPGTAKRLREKAADLRVLHDAAQGKPGPAAKAPDPVFAGDPFEAAEHGA